MHHRTHAFSLCALLLATPVCAVELVGADAVLKRLAEASAAAPVEPKASPLDELRQKIKTFAKEGGKMDPEAAAAAWLALYNAYVTVPAEVAQSASHGPERLALNSLIEALPPSSAWPALAEAVKSRPAGKNVLEKHALQLLTAVLTGDRAGRDATLARLANAVKSNTTMEQYQREQMEAMIEELAELLVSTTGTPEERMIAYDKALKRLEAPTGKKDSWRDDESLLVPDLVRLVGVEKSTPLLIRSLRLDVELSLDDRQTQRLAAKLALQKVDDLKRPVWNLVESTEDIPLYKALVAKFPKAEASFEKSAADTVYLLDLVAEGQIREAAQFYLRELATSPQDPVTLSSDHVAQMRRAGLGGKVLAFLKEMLGRDASLPLWSALIELSAQENQAGEALSFLKEALANPQTEQPARRQVQRHLYKALLAADEVDEAVILLQELVKSEPQSQVRDARKVVDELKKKWAHLSVPVTDEMLARYQRQVASRRESGFAEQVRLSLELAALGKILNRPALVEEGIAAAKAWFNKTPTTDYSGRGILENLVTTLVESGRFAEAETMLVDQLAEAVTPSQERSRGSIDIKQLLSGLAWTYLKSDRPADVVKLLEKSPLWQVPDLRNLNTVNFGRKPLLMIAAEALAKSDRKAEAETIALSLLQDYPAKDEIYALLATLNSANLEAQLDEVASKDRFEERPLIWKAILQLQKGNVGEAEETVRAAIAIDPSDGEQGKGDRMRAYAVLADILDKKGDAEQAQVMHGAVKSIRLSEASDDLWAAGLLTRAVKGYEAALSHFADAYCIQSRLALRYNELGEFEKAEMHYRRAFELMPESFGRVESHCFGCEGAFKGARAQNIADKVFTELAVKMPDRAQVFYLLGHLRQDQERLTEAAELYRKAVKIDPDYLNAWNKLAAVREDLMVVEGEDDDIQLALLRLDPMSIHSTLDLGRVSDLGKLWDQIIVIEASLPERRTGSIFPLSAAKAALEQLPSARSGGYSETFFDQRANVRGHFAQQPAIDFMISFVEGTIQRDW